LKKYNPVLAYQTTPKFYNWNTEYSVITVISRFEEVQSGISLSSNTEIYNWNTELSSIIVIIILISSTVHRLQKTTGSVKDTYAQDFEAID